MGFELGADPSHEITEEHPEHRDLHILQFAPHGSGGQVSWEWIPHASLCQFGACGRCCKARCAFPLCHPATHWGIRQCRNTTPKSWDSSPCSKDLGCSRKAPFLECVGCFSLGVTSECPHGILTMCCRTICSVLRAEIQKSELGVVMNQTLLSRVLGICGSGGCDDNMSGCRTLPSERQPCSPNLNGPRGGGGGGRGAAEG